MRLSAILLLFLLVVSTSDGAQTTCRIRTVEGWWTPPVELDTVRGDWLVYVDGSARDSMLLGDIGAIRRTRTSHVAGGLVGFGAGLLGAIAIAVPYAVAHAGIGHSQGEASPVPAYLALGSIVIGTTWGAIVGLDIHPMDDLTLDGLDAIQRRAALVRFILDTHLLEK